MPKSSAGFAPSKPTSLPPVCILAGGLGTRLGHLAATTPKPLIEVAGRPFLLHQLEHLSNCGIERAVLCVGHLGEQIEEAIGSNRFGIELSYSYDSPGLDGTLGAIRKALPLLDERFLILYGDTYLPIDVAVIARRWLAGDFPAMMTVLHNKGALDTSNVNFDGQLVVRYEKSTESSEMEWIDYGLSGLTGQALAYAPDTAGDLGTLFQALAQTRLLMGIPVDVPFYEIGTSDALRKTDEFLRSADPRLTKGNDQHCKQRPFPPGR